MALTKVSSSLVSDNAITTGKLVDGGVHSADIATNAITSTKIAQNSILTKHIDDGQVTTAQLGADAVTAAKIADDAISEEHLDVTVITGLTEVTAATGDLLMVADISDSNNLKKIPVSSILAGTHTGAINTSGTISSGAIDTSGTLTVNNGGSVNIATDTGKIFFGADVDARMFHDGANGKITNSTGGFYIGSDIIGLQNAAHNVTYLNFASGGAATFNSSVNATEVRVGNLVNNGTISANAVSGKQALTAKVANNGNSLFQGFNASDALITQITGGGVLTHNGIINSGAITSSGNLHAGDGTNISMDSSANGQLEVDGSGYQGAIALDGNAMHVYHNSASRDLVFGTNETARLNISGTGLFDFQSNNLQSIGTISSGAITSSGKIIATQLDLVGTDVYIAYGSAGTAPSNGDYLRLRDVATGNDALQFYMDSVKLFSIDGQSGNVYHKGTISSGAITSSGNIVNDIGASGADSFIEFKNTGYTGNVTSIRQNADSTRAEFNSTERPIHISAGSGGSASSATVKIYANQQLGLTIDSSKNATFGGAITSTGVIAAGTVATLFTSSDRAYLVAGTSDSSNQHLYLGSYHGSTLKQLTFSGSNNALYPQTTASIDLGLSSHKFKNLNLSGTISSGAITSVGNITNDYNDTISMAYAPGPTDYHKGMSGTSFNSSSTARGLHLFNFDNDSNLGINFWVGTSAAKQFAARIDSSGKVGIGTTAPASMLHIEGNTNGYNTSPLIYFGSTSTANAAVRDWAIGPADSDYGNFHIFRGASTGAAAVGTSQIAFTITSSGNVGIGATSPDEKLHVDGQAVFEGAGNTNRGNIIIGAHGSGSAKWSTLAGTHYNDATGSGNGSGAAGNMLIGGYSSETTNQVYIGGGPYELNPATHIRFYTHNATTHNLGGTERLTIDSAGDIIIGSTAKIYSSGDTDSYLQFNQANTLRAVIGDSTRMIINTGETVFNEDSGNFDFRIESDDNVNMFVLDAGGNDVRIGSATSYIAANLQVTQNHGTEKHLIALSSGADSTVSGSGQSGKYAEGTVACNTSSAGNTISIPITSQPNLWRQYQVEIMVCSAEYNKSNAQGKGGTATFGLTSLTSLNVGNVAVTGNISGVTVSGMNVLIEFTDGFTGGLSNYEGCVMYYKVLGITPEYFQGWAATLD